MTNLTPEQWAELEPLARTKMVMLHDAHLAAKSTDEDDYNWCLRRLADAEIAYNEKLNEIRGRE